MIVVKEVKFTDDEYCAVEKVANMIEEWRGDDDSFVVDHLMDRIVNDIYGLSRPSPDVDGWLEFMRTVLDGLADYMSDHDEAD